MSIFGAIGASTMGVVFSVLNLVMLNLMLDEEIKGYVLGVPMSIRLPIVCVISAFLNWLASILTWIYFATSLGTFVLGAVGLTFVLGLMFMLIGMQVQTAFAVSADRLVKRQQQGGGGGGGAGGSRGGGGEREGSVVGSGACGNGTSGSGAGGDGMADRVGREGNSKWQNGSTVNNPLNAARVEVHTT